MAAFEKPIHAILAGVLWSTLVTAALAGPPQVSNPNFVVILVDDQGLGGHECSHGFHCGKVEQPFLCHTATWSVGGNGPSDRGFDVNDGPNGNPEGNIPEKRNGRLEREQARRLSERCQTCFAD